MLVNSLRSVNRLGSVNRLRLLTKLRSAGGVGTKNGSDDFTAPAGGASFMQIGKAIFII